jgi:hypothetical protein
MIKTLAFHSYTIVKIVAAATLLIIALMSYLNIPLSLPIVSLSFLIGGIYVGYVIAYYSIKYLKEENIKKKLPFN